MQQASAAMVAINRASQKVAEIIGVINEIAFQTNLLTLNASVEAAFADEQGHGFAAAAVTLNDQAGEMGRMMDLFTIKQLRRRLTRSIRNRR